MIGAMILVWLALVAAGRTPVGRMMRIILVERPAVWLSRLTRGQVLLMGASLLLAVLLFWILEEEGLRMVGMYAPELMGMLASVELTSAIDVLAVAVASMATGRMRAALHWMRARLPARSGRAARPRRRPTQRVANDEDGPAVRWSRAA